MTLRGEQKTALYREVGNGLRASNSSVLEALWLDLNLI